MATDAICAFEYLYCGQLRLKRRDGYFVITNRRGDGFEIFNRAVDIKVAIGHEYPCDVELISPIGGKIFSCLVERGDDWAPIWRQILGTLGAAVEYGVDCERVLNRLAAKHRLALGAGPGSYKKLKNKIAALSADKDAIYEHLQDLERENQILRRLLADQILKE